MLEALSKRKELALRVKEETKLQREMMDVEIKKKLTKLKEKEKVEKKVNKRIKEKVNEELYKKLKDEVPSDSESDSDESLTSQISDHKPTRTKHVKSEKEPKSTVTNTITFV